MYGYGVYSIAFLIFMLPHGFVTVSIITALYPQLAGHAAGADLIVPGSLMFDGDPAELQQFLAAL